jgi:hypothetical protein
MNIKYYTYDSSKLTFAVGLRVGNAEEGNVGFVVVGLEVGD